MRASNSAVLDFISAVTITAPHRMTLADGQSSAAISMRFSHLSFGRL
jgi:hypothetical protein